MGLSQGKVFFPEELVTPEMPITPEMSGYQLEPSSESMTNAVFHFGAVCQGWSHAPFGRVEKDKPLRLHRHSRWYILMKRFRLPSTSCCLATWHNTYVALRIPSLQFSGSRLAQESNPHVTECGERCRGVTPTTALQTALPPTWPRSEVFPYAGYFLVGFVRRPRLYSLHTPHRPPGVIL